jgi:hypothetical protein
VGSFLRTAKGGQDCFIQKGDNTPEDVATSAPILAIRLHPL